jgi:hypothetical protein
MAKIIIKSDPSLTKEKVFELFKNHFRAKYEVYETKLFGADFVIKKSGSTGVSVRLVKKSDKTYLRFGAFAPSAAMRFLLYGLIFYLFVMKSWKKMTAEVREYIESEPAFK